MAAKKKVKKRETNCLQLKTASQKKRAKKRKLLINVSRVEINCEDVLFFSKKIKT